MEGVILLALAVMICRVFFAEGFMISTGSMAPSLLGYHRQVTCPDCGLHFVRGARYPDELTWSSEARASDQSTGSESITATVCPNCLASLDASQAPINEGDQLMVHKHAYEWRDPQRWEVVVFRNPTDPSQPYVKRVGGLPGETIEIREGDLYANGQIQRKPLDVQRSLRILVDDHDHQPGSADPDVQPRWIAARRDATYWHHQPGHVSFNDLSTSPTGEASKQEDTGVQFDWLVYRHWIRTGGTHRTEVPLAAWPEGIIWPDSFSDPVTYDPLTGYLTCQGALPWNVAKDWSDRSPDQAWQHAWGTLFRESHVTPIMDRYGYNHPLAVSEAYPVRDVMVSFDVRFRSGQGILVIRLTDGRCTFDCEFDRGHREVRLYGNDQPDPLRSAPFPAELLTKQASIEMSLFDRQVSVAVNQVELFTPVRYAASLGEMAAAEIEGTNRSSVESHSEVPRKPILLGANRLDLEIQHLRVYRDVYYTPKGGEVLRYELGPDEFFVLGDNSPVSSDSRAWEHPAIARNLLIGKPLIVHLPSQQWPLMWGGRTRYLRVPDLTRVRWIH